MRLGWAVQALLWWSLPVGGLCLGLAGAGLGPPIGAAFASRSPGGGGGVDSILELDPCLGAAPGRADCEGHREVFVDHTALLGQPGGVVLAYDYEAVTRALGVEELQDEGELSLAVRLIVSEVGADRLLDNQLGLGEAVGILFTVANRLDPQISNPLDHPRAPRFPGCGPGGAFVTCANAEQYLGMSTSRALRPAERYAPAILEPAVDVAVLAWHLVHAGLVADLTDGATNYVHRCGGVAYGRPTWACDAHFGGARRDDVRGANPFTGPLVFKAPTVYLPRQGFYGLRESMIIDYTPAEDEATLAAGGGEDTGQPGG
jgi:hypothetical protein